MRFNFTLVFISFIFILTSCGTSRKSSRTPTKVNHSNVAKSDAKLVLKTANQYLGTKYKYGGTDKRGMDCSGLVWVSFKTIGIETPRISYEQAEYGKKVKLSKVKPGDILFFNTSGNRISHAGIVDHIKNGEIFFIHSSSSNGVMISSLENPYWTKRFVIARRFLKE